ncbi:hypothetical protein CICLE_v10010812mg [Citrus x clementina]|uniref:Uncharacterized protein n=1 Tax=Citrus clementina TaxID=85681 RepID=V4WDW9_CITCL|nr:hypothetical protein CICLE_v10010812mg [Citrus x clementina]
MGLSLFSVLSLSLAVGLSTWVSSRGFLHLLSLSSLSSLFSRRRFPLCSHCRLHLSACFTFALLASVVVICRS